MKTLRWLLDTNICIYIAKQRPPGVARRFARLPFGSTGMSSITYGELRFGAEKSQQRAAAIDAVEQFASLVPPIPLDAAVGRAYGELRAQLQRAGTPIGNNDLWIAAHALSLGVTLVSHNTREFERVPKLDLQNWAN
jgi:tRNA(fMet)-specific endonuclease VapC